MSFSESVLLNALAFARHGHAVFPVNWPVERKGKLVCSCDSDRRGKPCGRNAAKHPYGKLAPNGLHSATTESGVIKHWFGYQAPQANLGVVTDRMVVIDVDPRHGGDESLAALEREHGDLPLTWRVLTGGGGDHVLYSCPDDVIIKTVIAENTSNPPLGRGIDVMARDAYIVAPPSRHISGRAYGWSVDHPREVPLAPAPDWLIARLQARTARSSNGSVKEPISSNVWTQLTGKKIKEYQDVAAAKIIGHLFRHNCDFQLVRGLAHAWNSARCDPKLDDEELDRIIDRIAVLEARRIRGEL